MTINVNLPYVWSQINWLEISTYADDPAAIAATKAPWVISQLYTEFHCEEDNLWELRYINIMYLSPHMLLF